MGRYLYSSFMRFSMIIVDLVGPAGMFNFALVLFYFHVKRRKKKLAAKTLASEEP